MVVQEYPVLRQEVSICIQHPYISFMIAPLPQSGAQHPHFNILRNTLVDKGTVRDASFSLDLHVLLISVIRFILFGH